MEFMILIIFWFLMGLSYIVMYGDNDDFNQHNIATRIFITFICIPIIVILCILTIFFIIFYKGDKENGNS